MIAKGVHQAVYPLLHRAQLHRPDVQVALRMIPADVLLAVILPPDQARARLAVGHLLMARQHIRVIIQRVRTDASMALMDVPTDATLQKPALENTNRRAQPIQTATTQNVPMDATGDQMDVPADATHKPPAREIIRVPAQLIQFVIMPSVPMDVRGVEAVALRAV